MDSLYIVILQIELKTVRAIVVLLSVIHLPASSIDIENYKQLN